MPERLPRTIENLVLRVRRRVQECEERLPLARSGAVTEKTRRLPQGRVAASGNPLGKHPAAKARPLEHVESPELPAGRFEREAVVRFEGRRRAESMEVVAKSPAPAPIGPVRQNADYPRLVENPLDRQNGAGLGEKKAAVALRLQEVETSKRRFDGPVQRLALAPQDRMKRFDRGFMAMRRVPCSTPRCFVRILASA